MATGFAEQVQIFVGVPGVQSPLVVMTGANATFADLLVAVKGRAEAGLTVVEELVVFGDQCEQPYDLAARLVDVGVGHRHQVHVHRHRQIRVTVEHAGQRNDHPFPPTATVNRVREWSVDAFGLAPEADYRLELLDQPGPLTEGICIGTLTHGHSLALELIHRELTIRYRVNAEEEESHERYRTARAILEAAGIAPDKYYLTRGNVSYQADPDKPIRLHNGEQFEAMFAGGGTVS
jgi:hypothetical protein